MRQHGQDIGIGCVQLKRASQRRVGIAVVSLFDAHRTKVCQDARIVGLALRGLAKAGLGLVHSPALLQCHAASYNDRYR